jgi:twitching motility protein PilT
MSRKLIDGYLRTLVDAGGSDLHLRAGGPPRIRVNGVLEEIAGAPPLSEEDTERIAADIIRPHLRERWAQGLETDFAYNLPGVARFRVNAYRQRDSVALVIRQVVSRPKGVGELKLPEVVSRFAEEPRGLVLCCGPTGSGKTTTLAAMVDQINRTRTAHIVTIEDPIEVLHQDDKSSISQRELGSDTRDFAQAMRAALRQDPDVILVGEMRDSETVATALQAAETGHLVLSTLHTNDAAETIDRIVEFFPANEQRQVRLVLAGVLKGIVSQRLVPTKDGHSRVAATEVLVVNGRVQSWILDPNSRHTIEDIISEGEYYGMHTFDQCLLEMVANGTIELHAAMATSSRPHDLQVMLRQRGIIGRPTPEDEERIAAEAAATEELHELVSQLGEAEQTSDEITPGVAPVATRSRRKR